MPSISLTRLNIAHYVSQLEQHKNNALPPIKQIQIKLDINEAYNSPLMDITTISSNQILTFYVPYKQHYHISKTKNAITLANLSIIKKFLLAIPDETDFVFDTTVLPHLLQRRITAEEFISLIDSLPKKTKELILREYIQPIESNSPNIFIALQKYQNKEKRHFDKISLRFYAEPISLEPLLKHHALSNLTKKLYLGPDTFRNDTPNSNELKKATSQQLFSLISELDINLELFSIGNYAFSAEQKEQIIKGFLCLKNKGAKLKTLEISSAWLNCGMESITQCINSLPVCIESIVLIPRTKQLTDNLIDFIELFDNLETAYKNILFDFTRESSQEMDVHIEAFSIYIIENYLKNKPLFPQEMRVAISINDKILKQLNARGNDTNLNAVINLFAQKTNSQLQIHNELNTSNAPLITTLQTLEIQKTAPSTTDNIVMALASKYIATYFPEGQITFNSKKRPHSALEETTLSSERQLSLISLNSVNNYQSAFSSMQSLSINDDIMHLSLYSALSKSPLSRSDCCYFVMAGRKNLALVPPKSTTRCIIVLTEAEFNQLYPQQMIRSHYDFLVIHSFTPIPNARLSAITIRRRAALHCAYVLDLPHFIMMDDNIKSLNSQNQDSSLPYNANEAYQEFLTLLTNAQEPLISLPTKANNDVIKANQNALGSKVFLFNMELIRQLLPNTSDALALFPSNEESFGEDYFMQLMLHMLCKEKLQDQRQGFQIVDNTMSITRDQTDINSCLAQGIQARPLDYSSNQITLIDTQINDIHHRAIELFNHKFSKMITLINHSQNHKKNIDLSQQAAKQLHQNTLPAMPKPTRPFKQQLKFNLQNALKDMSTTLYPHQRAALEFLQENLLTPNATRFNFDIATGCGKTLIQSTIAFNAFLANSNQQHGVIVCPTIQLTEQMKQALLDNATQLLSPELQAVIMPRIHAVCTTELSISTVLLNKSLQQPCLFVICQASYNELLEQTSLISQFGFIIHDESHKVEKEENNQKIILAKSAQLREDIKGTPQISTFSFSATPKQTNDQFRFCYTREQGINDKILTPLILDDSFSEDSFSPEQITYLLNNHRTPNNHLLKTQKGIIYVSSKEKVNTLIQKIQTECPDTPFFEIHSGQINPYELIKQFKQSKQGVAIVIGMLVEGFDDPSVSWLLINKKTISKENGIQMIGRILRKNTNAPEKIGLAIMPRVLNQKHLNEHTIWPKNEIIPNRVQEVQKTIHKINQHNGLHQLSVFAHSINKAQFNQSDNDEQAITIYEEERQLSDDSLCTALKETFNAF